MIEWASVWGRSLRSMRSAQPYTVAVELGVEQLRLETGSGLWLVIAPRVRCMNNADGPGLG